MVKPITKVLIANRGEIAARIIRTCRRLGIQTVAVYSEADRESPHVVLADEAICIGPPPSRESYLNMDRIIAAAKERGADAIHPGYGFLSENDAFAKAVTDAGLNFIGPSAYSIHMMGNKLAAKEAARSFSIPLVPGSDNAIGEIEEAKRIGASIGFPLLIKAAAGGGGKGMRIVRQADELASQVERAMSEALSAFGDGSVFIEKYIGSPRHIEIQVLADKHGNTVHLFERECSIQRRHQKIVEEAPSSILTPAQREQMGQDAVMAARSCDYVGAGTVEFLVDENGKHYFLEMNTRLQVEHPVTEMITRLDLVELQIRIAEGHPLPFQQSDLRIRGHALELRVYAENALAGFIPSTGTLHRYQPPVGEGIRVDDGFREGMTVPIHYDPMLSKLVVHANSRIEAIERMRMAIDDYIVEGVDTTLEFGKFAITHPDFIEGNFDTHFVDKHMDEFTSQETDLHTTLAHFAAWLFEKKKAVLVLPNNHQA